LLYNKIMGTLGYQWSYRRNLPHYQLPGSTLFITFRLDCSLPQTVIETLMQEKARTEVVLNHIVDDKECAERIYAEERRLFGKWDEALNKASSGPLWLKDSRVSELMVESLKHRDGKEYDLDAYCIMANHVHVVFTPLQKEDGTYYALPKIMHSLKRCVGREGNKLLGREGPFWQHESYDHVVRNDAELGRIVRFVLNNPAAAGLATRWEDWQWSYYKNL
jgi:putative transposase